MSAVLARACRRPLLRYGARHGIGLTAALLAVGVAHAHFAADPAAPGAISCLGPHDLIISAGLLTLDGAQTFDRLCVLNGGHLIAAGGLTLRVGALYVDAGAAITADGQPGGFAGQTDCRQTGNGTPDGSPGNTLLILAHQATILGRISADGGAGFAGVTQDQSGSCGESQTGHGGTGGRITLETGALTLSGPVSAAGGPGGAGASVSSFAQDVPPATPVPPAENVGGAGGAGGTITVLVPRPLTAAESALLQVPGGAAGAGRPRGRAGAAGTVNVAALGAAQRAALPPAPPPLVTALRPSPARRAPLPAAAFARGMACGAGDLALDAGATRRLSGIQRYTHVCILAGARLLAGPGLVLTASTLLVDAGASIVADGTVPPARGGPGGGQYASAGPRTLDRRPPHAGVPGAKGIGDPSNGVPGAPGGAGGGTIVVIAARIDLAGVISADGARGGRGDDGGCSPSGCIGPFDGAGGGSGGGILLQATDLQLTGTISVAGGDGGQGGTNDSGTGESGPHGSAGYVKIVAGTLRVAAGPLPVRGPALVIGLPPAGPAPTPPAS